MTGNGTRVRKLRSRSLARGFTLVELLIVVAMIGVLAALAFVGYRRYIQQAHTGEVQAMVSALRAGEEAYKAETLVYLNCDPANNLTTYYPHAAPDKTKWHWINPGHPQMNCYRTLSGADSPVRYVYSIIAGPPGAQPPAVPGLANPIVWQPVAQITDVWYVVYARGDMDGNNVFSHFVASSFSGEIYHENDSE